MQPTTIVVQGHDKNMGIQMYNVQSMFLQASLSHQMPLNNKYIFASIMWTAAAVTTQIVFNIWEVCTGAVEANPVSEYPSNFHFIHFNNLQIAEIAQIWS